MFTFTKEERLILIIVTGVLFIGSTLHYAYKKYPHLKDAINFVESDQAYPKLDINRATYDELVAVPYIGAYSAGEIIRLRERLGGITSLEQVKTIRGIKDKNYQIFSKYLKVKRFLK